VCLSKTAYDLENHIKHDTMRSFKKLFIKITDFFFFFFKYSMPGSFVFTVFKQLRKNNDLINAFI